MAKKVPRAKLTVRKAKMYLNRSRLCCKCGSSRTSDNIVNHILWHSDVDCQGKWTGKWKCHRCYSRDYAKNRRLDADKMRQLIIDTRNHHLEEDEMRRLIIGARIVNKI